MLEGLLLLQVLPLALLMWSSALVPLMLRERQTAPMLRQSLALALSGWRPVPPLVLSGRLPVLPLVLSGWLPVLLLVLSGWLPVLLLLALSAQASFLAVAAAPAPMTTRMG